MSFASAYSAKRTRLSESTSTVVSVEKKTGLVKGEGHLRESLRLSAYAPAVTTIPQAVSKVTVAPSATRAPARSIP
jgi:hypothetical protein